jgi:hypothetical protein
VSSQLGASATYQEEVGDLGLALDFIPADHI